MSITKKSSAKIQKRLCVAECLRPDLQNIRPSLVGNQASVAEFITGMIIAGGAEVAQEKLLDSSRRSDPNAEAKSLEN
jgi:hypothetical protein